MRTRLYQPVLTLCLILAALLGQSWLLSPDAHSTWTDAPGGSPMSTPITNKEIIRNGGFDHDKTAWYLSGISSYVDATAGQDGGPALIMEEIVGNNGNGTVVALQTLPLPSQTTAAIFSFDYRLVQTYGPVASFEAGLMRGNSLSTATVITAVLSSGEVYATTNWQHVSGSLSAADVAQVQAAHEAGEQVWFVFNLVQNPNQFQAYLDNVSFQVTGNMDYPAVDGAIAYVGADAANNPKTVKRINPDGSGEQTLWTHPGTVPESNKIYDVAWKPDGSELAFSSNHETAYSAFHSDVYGIKPDGSGLRRITNPPSKAEIDAGGYQMGTVTGRIQNNYGSVTTFYVYVEGAQDVVPVDVGEFNDEVGFTVPNVADLGTGLHYVVFIWSKGTTCANGREYSAAVVDVTPGGTVDAGTLQFSGTCGTYDSSAITWKRDGSALGVDVITPRTFAASGQAIGTDLFSAPLTADKPAWSPVDDRILYRNWIVSGDSGIYLTTAGGATGTWLVNDGGALWVTPAWLPDGSGFVYTVDRQIRQHLFSGNQDTLLAEFYNEYVDNPSVSPDGQYVVFERQSTGTPTQYDVWVIKRSQPTEMWALTEDGRSYNPDWSRQNPPTQHTLYLPALLRNAR
jgi:TolB protein